MGSWGWENTFPLQSGVHCLQMRTSRCLRQGSRAQTPDFCFKPLTNPPSKRVQLLPSHANKQAPMPYGEDVIVLTEDWIRPLKLSSLTQSFPLLRPERGLFLLPIFFPDISNQEFTSITIPTSLYCLLTACPFSP